VPTAGPARPSNGVPTFTHGEVPAYHIAAAPWSKAEYPTVGSGHLALRNGRAGATTSVTGIWVEGGSPPGTSIHLLFVCLGAPCLPVLHRAFRFLLLLAVASSVFRSAPLPLSLRRRGG